MARKYVESFANRYLDRVIEQLGLASDYACAKRLKLTPQAITKIRAGGAVSPTTAARIAELLELNPLHVIAEIESERHLNDIEARAVWQRIVKQIGKAAGIVAVAFAPALTSPDAQARFDNSKNVPTSAHQEAGRNTQCATRRRRSLSTFALAARALLALPGQHFAL